MWYDALHKETAPGSGERWRGFKIKIKRKQGTFNLNSIMNHIIRPDV